MKWLFCEAVKEDSKCMKSIVKDGMGRSMAGAVILTDIQRYIVDFVMNKNTKDVIKMWKPHL